MGGTILVLLALAAVAVFGLWLGLLHLAGRPRPGLVLGAHILIGLAAFEALIVTIQGLEAGTSRLGGQAALGLMAVAVGLGLAGPLVAKESRPKRRAMLAGHAGMGAAGILLGIAWVATR